MNSPEPAQASSRGHARIIALKFSLIALAAMFPILLWPFARRYIEARVSDWIALAVLGVIWFSAGLRCGVLLRQGWAVALGFCLPFLIGPAAVLFSLIPMQAAPSAEIALRLLPWFLAVQVGAYAGAAVVGLLPTLFLSARMFLAGIAGFSSGAAMGAVVIAAAFLATSIGPAGFLMFPLALVLPAAVAGYLLVRFGGCGIEAKR